MGTSAGNAIWISYADRSKILLAELNNTEQEVRIGKCGIRPTTNHQCLDNGSKPDKSVPFRTIGQSMPTSQKATKTQTTRGRTNIRCTGNNTHCTHRCNISIKKDFYREHSSRTCTQENNGGSHRRYYQHTHRIYVTVVPNNGPYLGHPSSSGRAGKVVSKTGLSKSNPNSSSDMREGDGLVLHPDPYQRHLLLQDDPHQHTAQLPTSSQ